MVAHLSRSRLGHLGWKRWREDAEKSRGQGRSDYGQQDGDGAVFCREKTELHADGGDRDDEAQSRGQEDARGGAPDLARPVLMRALTNSCGAIHPYCYYRRRSELAKLLHSRSELEHAGDVRRGGWRSELLGSVMPVRERIGG